MPTSVHGASKVACEQLVERIATEYGLDGVQPRESAGSMVPIAEPARSSTISFETPRTGQRTIIPCDPGFIYHYIHVDDVAEAMPPCSPRRRFSEACYNVGSAAKRWQCRKLLRSPRVAQAGAGRLRTHPGGGRCP